MAEKSGSRTHQRRLTPLTGFEVRATHRGEISSSRQMDIARGRFILSARPHHEAPERRCGAGCWGADYDSLARSADRIRHGSRRRGRRVLLFAWQETPMAAHARPGHIRQPGEDLGRPRLEFIGQYAKQVWVFLLLAVGLGSSLIGNFATQEALAGRRCCTTCSRTPRASAAEHTRTACASTRRRPSYASRASSLSAVTSRTGEVARRTG